MLIRFQRRLDPTDCCSVVSFSAASTTPFRCECVRNIRLIASFTTSPLDLTYTFFVVNNSNNNSAAVDLTSAVFCFHWRLIGKWKTFSSSQIFGSMNGGSICLETLMHNRRFENPQFLIQICITFFNFITSWLFSLHSYALYIDCQSSVCTLRWFFVWLLCPPHTIASSSSINPLSLTTVLEYFTQRYLFFLILPRKSPALYQTPSECLPPKNFTSATTPFSLALFHSIPSTSHTFSSRRFLLLTTTSAMYTNIYSPFTAIIILHQPPKTQYCFHTKHCFPDCANPVGISLNSGDN